MAQLGEAVYCVVVTQLGAVVLRWLCKEPQSCGGSTIRRSVVVAIS